MAIYKAIAAWDGGVKTPLYAGDAIEADDAQRALEIAEEIVRREDPPDSLLPYSLTVMNVEDAADMASARFHK